MTSRRLFHIIHEDDDLLAVDKPADLVCHPTKGDAFSSLISQLRLYLGTDAAPALINRLDRETSGVVLVGKHPRATLEARRLWESRVVEKRYWAIVHGWIEPSEGTLDAPLGKDVESAVAIKNKVRPDGTPAQTQYVLHCRFERESGRFSLLQLCPATGRKHQIRIHLAWRGHPIVGDKLYGGDEDLYLALVERRLTDADRAKLLLPCQALHAHQVRLPWRGQTRVYQAEPESWFVQFVREGGGTLPKPAEESR